MFKEDGRTFHTKWEAKDNPLGTALRQMPDGRFAPVLYPDRFRIPTVRQDVLAAGESKILDIAVKWRDDPNAYIWDPMIFERLDYTDARVKFDGGKPHPFDLYAEWGGESRRIGVFILESHDVDGPDSLTVSRVR
ncbi:MAG: hypothetical protein ACREDE_10035 [Thermoplasmata archaeon]